MKTQKTLTVGVVIVLAIYAGIAQATWLGEGEYTDTANTSALYHLNQSSGTTVIDDNSSGRTAHNGTLENGPTWTTAGRFGNGLDFTYNSNDRLNMGNIIHSPSYTIEFYFKWEYRYTSEPGYLFNADGLCWARTNLITHDPGPATAKVTFGVRDGSGHWLEINGGDTYSLDSNWHHLAFVREYISSTNTTNTYYYLDGELAASQSHAGGYWSQDSDLLLGYTIGGTFDEIRFTPEALDTFGVPEPATVAILGIGGLLLRRR